MAESKLDWPKLMEEALTAPGNLGDTCLRFWSYSLTNELLFLMQGLHEPVASYSRWKALGRQVVRGARTKEVIVPVLVNELVPEPGEEQPTGETAQQKKERIARLIGFKVVRAMFPLSDTEGNELPEVSAPGWNLQTALEKLGVREVPFDKTNGNIQGYSRALEFAINPLESTGIRLFSTNSAISCSDIHPPIASRSTRRIAASWSSRPRLPRTSL